MSVCKALIFPVLFFILFFTTISQLTLPHIEMDSVDQYTVASSTPSTNYFISDQISDVNDVIFETPIDLTNCTALNAMNVAIV